MTTEAICISEYYEEDKFLEDNVGNFHLFDDALTGLICVTPYTLGVPTLRTGSKETLFQPSHKSLEKFLDFKFSILIEIF